MVKNGLNPRTILFMPANSQGHVNSSVAIAQVFVERGHRVVFILEKPFQGKLKSYDIQEVILESIIDPNNDQAKDDQEYWPAFVAKNCSIFRKTPIDIIERFNVQISESLVKIERAKEGQYKKIIESVKPDLMVLDTYLCSPCLTNSGIPWVRIISTNPLLALEDEASPPGMSGLPSSGVNVEQEWIKFQSRKKELYEPIWKDVNEWVLSLNAPQLPPNPLLHPDSPYANLYMQPKEIDLYQDQGFPLRPNWFRFDSFIRETKETFILPESFKTRKGKLIYLSMGTIGSADVSLMTRLVDILKDSPNKFIVSKGVLGDKYRLPDNMWGQNSLPQTKVIPLVDLVLTHGGNNTICETFLFGKRMIALPLFSDQFDNAERVREKGFGFRLNPYHCSREELLDAVRIMLDNQDLAHKMLRIGERMRGSKSNERAADLILNQI